MSGIIRRQAGLASLSLLLPLAISAASGQREVQQPSQPDQNALVEYLRANWKSPEDYVVDKFKTHDLVFIGEYHRIKHDVELIHRLIPRLYQAGVRDLGIEFGASEYQEQVDALITADRYDEEMARWLMFKNFVVWGYQEYMDIYRKVWELNKPLPAGAPRFRVINLNYRQDWTARQESMTPELWERVWHKGDSDEYMAQVILREFVDKKRKALIYSGSHHAFTRYHQPNYDFRNRRLIRLMKNRMGNLVHAKIPGRIFNIFLHSPWASSEGFERSVYPVGGAIDRAMKHFRDQRVGFDVKGTPFGELRDNNTYYSLGYDDFTLATFCDGYIFQKQLVDYEGCTVDPAFITEKNLQEAIANLPNPQARKSLTTPKAFIDAMREDADMGKRMRRLERIEAAPGPVR